MAARKITFDTVREIGLALAGAEEGTTYGTPALKVGGRMFACIASHRSTEPDTLAVFVHPEQREELLREEPSTYYLTDHYVNYPIVLGTTSARAPRCAEGSAARGVDDRFEQAQAKQ